MAWNPSPEVAAARDFGNKFDAEQVVIVHLNRTTGKIGLVTYGKTKKLCEQTKNLGEVAYCAVHDAVAAGY